MTSKSWLTVVLGLGLALPAAVSAEDARVLVELPPPMAEHMLANMRDHLDAIGEIQHALGSRQFQHASELAESRLGVSSLAAHGAAHMAAFMPQPMQAIGAQMHRQASRFAIAAQDAGADGNVAKALVALSAVTAQCVACHAAYRVK